MSEGSEELPPLSDDFVDTWDTLEYPEDLVAAIDYAAKDLNYKTSQAVREVNDLIVKQSLNPRNHHGTGLKLYQPRGEWREEGVRPDEKEVTWDRNRIILDSLYRKFEVEVNDAKIRPRPTDEDGEEKYAYEILRFSPTNKVAFIEYYGFFDDLHIATDDFSDVPDIFYTSVITLIDDRLPFYLQDDLDN